MKYNDSLTSRLGSTKEATTTRLNELIDAVDSASYLIASSATIDSLSLPSDHEYREILIFPDAFTALGNHQISGDQ
jgi:hypothetical protein